MNKFILKAIVIFWSITSYGKLCNTTKSYIDNYEPKSFQNYNNLTAKQGYPPTQCGKIIKVTGRVLDANCFPVSDAIVYIWQVGCDGKYHYEPLRQNLDKSIINTEDLDPFVGSGTAITNSYGEFIFITVYPVKNVFKENPHINIRIKHHDFTDLQTKLFFNKKNTKHKTITLYPQTTNNDEYFFEIVLPNTKKY